ncbi:hypothetical protein [Flavobacterium sp.]|jgi:hypothetical protein|uniref:hypothetical protein n=1 Tax=Flavobacterium sp. TaxID=239 RepID=UPI0037C03222
MRKLVILLSVFALFACSNNDEEVEQQNVPTGFLKQVKDSNLGGIVTYDYFYSGSKLLKIVGGNQIKKYSYTGDLITDIEIYDTTQNLVSKETFEYNSNSDLVATKTLYYSNDLGYRTELIYNLDGTVLINNFNGNLLAQDTFNFSNKLYFSNSEVVKSEINFNSNTSIMQYEYDSSINPMNQVMGYSKLNLHRFNGVLISQFHQIGNIHNCNKVIIDDPNESGIVDYDYFYDANGKPSYISSDGNETSIFDLGYFQYIYQE